MLRKNGSSRNISARRKSLSLHQLEQETKLSVNKQHAPHNNALSGSHLLLLMVAAVVALSSRIEIQRRILLRSECASRSVVCWLPTIIAIYDALRYQTWQRIHQEDADKMDNTVYQDFRGSLRSFLLSSSYRFVPGAILLSTGCYIMSGIWLSSESNHVCPIISMDRLWIPRLQLLALFLDSFLTIAAAELAMREAPSKSLLTVPVSWSIVLSSTAMIWLAASMFIVSTQPEHKAWLFMQTESSQMGTSVSLLGKAVVLAIICVSVLYSVSWACGAKYLADKSRSLPLACYIRQ